VIHALASSSAWGGSVKYAEKKMMGMSAKLVCSRPICAFRGPRGFQKSGIADTCQGTPALLPRLDSTSWLVFAKVESRRIAEHQPGILGIRFWH
jgi:hypothetical protein